MGSDKQQLFMSRVLKLYDMAYAKRTSAKQIIRLDVDRWDNESDVACVAATAITELGFLRNEAGFCGLELFDP